MLEYLQRLFRFNLIPKVSSRKFSRDSLGCYPWSFSNSSFRYTSRHYCCGFVQIFLQKFFFKDSVKNPAVFFFKICFILFFKEFSWNCSMIANNSSVVPHIFSKFPSIILFFYSSLVLGCSWVQTEIFHFFLFQQVSFWNFSRY